ncbi:uncharacterized protein AMSG_02927 [Thecamonas trahens ATCC 50062]|uniref:Uncharacterized protein n=1 Tax=Thecamonas trahens ATCC 50062 TaxID=461836 RepID=A0A0L0D2G7_THETB|nr:hypothetical protein AMSG_02927 [Thecamonas trahens ATCC 50062]KNC46492.1 hypothetical protein AMSG_02927 [Thecamonas trahens ATCC 50062]|eukprot:XP_013760273.1 hypothetical protein AMSG_02927 [Thecamonas trahens ATCC 50062]
MPSPQVIGYVVDGGETGSDAAVFSPRFVNPDKSVYSGLYEGGPMPKSGSGSIRGAVDASPGVFPYAFGEDASEPVVISIERRPTLDGENHVAGVIWNAARALCEYMVTDMGSAAFEGKSVLEIGSGTGLTGMVAAALGATVVLTDQEPAIAMLRDQIALNKLQNRVSAAQLDWGPDGDNQLAALGDFDLILGTDVTYTALKELQHTLLALTSGPTPPQLLFCHERRWPGTDAYFEKLMAPHFDYTPVHATSFEDSGEIVVFTLTRKAGADMVAGDEAGDE